MTFGNRIVSNSKEFVEVFLAVQNMKSGMVVIPYNYVGIVNNLFHQTNDENRSYYINFKSLDKDEKGRIDFEKLAELIGGQVAGTRPTIEAGWIDPRKQIGLSGRTVKPKLIITCGVSGAVQFVAGMKSSDYIIAINQDENASIFDVAHLSLIGDIYEIIPKLIEKIENIKNIKTNDSEVELSLS